MPITTQVRVRYAETDQMGIVYYANYLVWFEIGRVELLRSLGLAYSQLETDFFAQEPVIPLWYNGAWFQGNTSVWSDYPASAGSDQNMPVMWAGYLGAMTTVYALADLRPTPKAAS